MSVVLEGSKTEKGKLVAHFMCITFVSKDHIHRNLSQSST